MTTFRTAREAMGTRFELVLRGRDPAHLRAVAEEALAEVARLDARWSAFRADSDLADVNRRAALGPVQLDVPLMDLLTRARELWRLTGGAFDPALGSLMGHWGFHRQNPPNASPMALRESLARAGMQHVVLDPDRRQVRFRVEGLQLDLGAIGKGSAIDCAAEICRQAGVEAGLVHAGTSSVYAFGEAAPGVPWEVGIPTVATARQGWTAADLGPIDRESALLARVVLRDRALGLSAPWGREIAREGEALGHVLDPHLGRPSTGVSLAAVVAPRAEEADALATALIVGGADLQARLAATRPDWRSLLVLEGEPIEKARVVRCGL